MRRLITAFVVYCWALLGQNGVTPEPAQARSARAMTRPPDSGMQYVRLVCLVHLQGSGKLGDAVRPEYTPATDGTASRNDVLAWSAQLTDDGKMAIVQLVAANPLAFSAIRTDQRPEVRVFEIGKNSRAEIETEMRKHRKDFSLDSIQVVAP